jgi:hypothetical protein
VRGPSTTLTAANRTDSPSGVDALTDWNTEAMTGVYQKNWRHLMDVNPDELRAMASQLATRKGLDLPSNADRTVINMLRHDFTNYDGRVQSAVSDGLYNEILDEIAKDFPWLADQCAKDKATHFAFLDPWVQARRWAHSDASQRQRVARDAIKSLSVGGKVMVNWRGLMREGQVIEVRRTRVKVQFELDSGDLHVIDRPANEVQTLDT